MMAEAPGNDTSVVLTISGRVQGVWFRVWLRDRALELGLRGWVKNTRKGNVEALVAGSEDSVRRLVSDCHDGPPLARVDRVVRCESDEQVPQAFEISPSA